jgi:hypothetical protein
VLACDQLYADVHCHGGAPHRVSAFHVSCYEWSHAVFSVPQYTSDVIAVPCCMNSTISTPFLSQKTAAINLLADVYLNFFGLSGECVRIHCFNCSLVSTFTNKTQVSSPVTRTMRLRNSSPSLCHSKNVHKNRSHSLCLMLTHDHF